MDHYTAVQSLVPPLRLTHSDALELRELGDQFVHETMQQYHDFHVARRGVVDKSRWKEIRRKDDIRVYTERETSALKSTRIKGYLGDRRGSHAPDTHSLPPFLVVGTVVGDLDDVMYATTTPTVSDMKIKTAYVEDGLVGSKVLQQLLSPTHDDPFRNLAVKWCLVHPAKVQSLIRARDYTYVDSTGIAISLSGERIGYRITHSIAFPGFPNFEEQYTVVRGNTSICCLYKQRSPNVVDCFVTGFFELHGDVLKGLARLAIAGQGLSFSKQVHCAQMKKLAWRLQQSKAMSVAPTPPQHDCGGVFAVTTPDTCKVCAREFVASRFGFGPITKRCCTLCAELVCSKCRVKKRLYFMGRGRQLIAKDLLFCLPCVTETVRLDAYELAKQEFAYARDVFDPHATSYGTWSRSSHSSSSSGCHRPLLATVFLTTPSVDALEALDEDS